VRLDDPEHVGQRNVAPLDDAVGVRGGDARHAAFQDALPIGVEIHAVAALRERQANGTARGERAS
jgi:hypothetical protein